MGHSSRRVVSSLIAFVALCAGASRVAAAQAVRGTIVDRADAPVPGVIVMLLDDRSIAVARALTSESGEFRVAASQPGTYRVRTLRIGFRPSTSEPLALAAGQDVDRRIALADIPVSLDTIKVTGRNNCSIRGDTAAATYGAWEQVRAALTAAQLTAGSRTLEARLISYSRALEPGSRGRMLRQFARAREGLTTRPFRSLGADTLSRRGYVVPDAAGTTYYAPDIDVLLSDVFIDDHCLQIARDADPSSIAIAFTPVESRSRIPEIAGTVWVDRRTSELRRLEFEYVNISHAQRTGNPGGAIEFVRLRNGAWMIASWHIRMPVTERRLTDGPRMPGVDPERLVVRELRVDGSELTSISRRGDTLWARPSPTLTGLKQVCHSRVYVDSVQVSRSLAESRFDVDSIPPGRLDAIEYYASPAQTPARYRSTGSECGVLVIHTR